MKPTSKTTATGCDETSPCSRKRECVPCDIPEFCRNNYFTGKLLTARDFVAEQQYLRDKLRLHHVALHGWGIVCGLKVVEHPMPGCLKIRVEPGLAIDGCGREIQVPCIVDLDPPLIKNRNAKPEEPCPPEPEEEKEEHGKEEQHSAQMAKHTHPQGQYSEPPCEDDEPTEEPPKPDEPCPPQPPRYTLYVCLRYAECETEFAPAPFDECACSGNGQKPGRICESYELEITTERPAILEKIKNLKDKCEIGDCESIYDETLNPCPKPFDVQCIPLSVIENYTPGEKITEKMIDNWAYRVLLPSTSLLDQLIRCILDKLPTRVLTHICDIGWTHRGQYSCHDFMRQFIGDPKYPKGFEVVFDGPLVPDGLSRRTFQAIVVRYPEKGAGARPEVAPASVRWNDDHTRAYLHIDPDYAQRNLHNTRFDLFILLRCNFLLDIRGNAVDGDFLAKLDDEGHYQAAPPTGDGIPGGLFESWIRVR
jgi:hypothetical protein